MKRFGHYQGFCHECQRGYYYPGGDCFAKPEDPRPLMCALPKCRYCPSKDTNAIDGHAVLIKRWEKEGKPCGSIEKWFEENEKRLRKEWE